MIVVKRGEIWQRNPEMKYYWGEDTGKLVIVTSVSCGCVDYRYIGESDSRHLIGTRPIDSFKNRFVLIE